MSHIKTVIIGFRAHLDKPGSSFKKKKINLFILFLAMLGLSCCMRDLCCGMRDPLLRQVGGLFAVAHWLLSSCGVWVSSLVWRAGSRVCRLCSCGVQVPERMGSVVCGMRAL